MILKSTFLCLIMFVLTLCHSMSAFASANVSLLPLPDGKSWTVQATGFTNIAGVDLTITYDSNVLSNPRVVQGSFVAGSMFLPNTTAAGTIRIGIITTKALYNSGPIATISFDRKSSGAPNFAINARLTDNNLTPAPVTVDQQTQTPDAKGDNGGQSDPYTGNQGGQNGNPSPPYAGSGAVVTGGTITMPSDMNTTTEDRKSDRASEFKEEPRREAPAVARDTNDEPELKQPESGGGSQKYRIEPAKAILTRFKEYKGEMTSKALIDLFAAGEKAVVRQDPPIMIADGKTSLKVIIPGSAGETAPNFALKKAKLVSLKMSTDNNWIVEAKPDKGATDAVVTVLLDDKAVEIPINCAPKVDVDVDKSGKVDDKDFKLFLNDRGTAKLPKYDVNNDGSRNYVDDYIFTANFIAIQPKAKEKADAVKTIEKPKDAKQKGEASDTKVKTKTK